MHVHSHACYFKRIVGRYSYSIHKVKLPGKGVANYVYMYIALAVYVLCVRMNSIDIH